MSWSLELLRIISLSGLCGYSGLAFRVSGWTFTSSDKSPSNVLPRASPSFLPTIKLSFLTHSLFSKPRHNCLLDFCSWNGKLCFEKTSVFDYESYPFDLNGFIDVWVFLFALSSCEARVASYLGYLSDCLIGTFKVTGWLLMILLSGAELNFGYATEMEADAWPSCKLLLWFFIFSLCLFHGVWHGKLLCICSAMFKRFTNCFELLSWLNHLDCCDEWPF